MAKNLAMATRHQPLKYAQLMQGFLINEAGFERRYFFSDDSPDIGGK
ncbi:hypothetical protein HCG51_02750 [Tolypothrix sp. PCC 7910]|nr:hypothetical protein [Tolypothrix sp. PCC 7910]QIR35262.1 hypothetical protein HCG51_02750 [Tolypothrix sp. PCC 7910]